MEDSDPGPSPLWLLSAGEHADSITLAAGFVVVVLAVAAATAIRNFRWTRLERVLASEERLARYEGVLKDDRPLLDSLLILQLIGLVSLILGLFGVFGPSRMHEPGGGAGALRFLALLGEGLGILLVPFGIVRGLVRARPERTLICLIGFTRAVEILVRPIRWVVDGLSAVFTRALGLQEQPAGEDEDVQEILEAVSEGEHGGAIEEDEREMIESIIEFQDLAVSAIMTPRTSVTSVSVDATLDEVVRVIVDKGHSRLPVHEESIDNVLGVLHAKDVLPHLLKPEIERPTVRDLVRKPLFVPETKNISDLLKELRHDKVHLAIVLDEYGGMSGLVTIEDIIEEIIGDIEDEFDPAKAGPEDVTLINEREAEVSARVHIDDLNEALKVELPENGSYDTLGGFIFAQLGRIPEPGETWDFENVRFHILDADPRRINRVKVVVGEE